MILYDKKKSVDKSNKDAPTNQLTNEPKNKNKKTPIQREKLRTIYKRTKRYHYHVGRMSLF